MKSISFFSCSFQGETGPDGPPGPPGNRGDEGAPGTTGNDGADGGVGDDVRMYYVCWVNSSIVWGSSQPWQLLIYIYNILINPLLSPPFRLSNGQP